MTKYQVCSRCIMDTTAEDIYFGKDGICNYCSNFLKRQNKVVKDKKNLDELISNIKNNGKNKKYDCIIGISGGVDSSYSLIKACELGLNPLAVHLDNGWNSELAQHNISKLIRTYNVDLYTHVINWKEYRNLQEAFLKANVIDIELLMDNAMLAVNYKLASKYNIKYILSGTNTATEGFKIPENWSWFKNDAKNIKSIVKKFSSQKLKTFPTFGTFDYIYYEFFKKINWVLFPDYFEYDKKKAINLLINKINFKPYPYKHYESIFTRFYQAYILPKKFGVDKRKLHLSNLIVSDQISKEEAKRIIQQPTYPNEDDEKKDIKYFLKKMKWPEKDLLNYISKPEISHLSYGSEKTIWKKLKKVYLSSRLLKLIIKKNIISQ
jgi:N-acetyl sugar amidotransferase